MRRLIPFPCAGEMLAGTLDEAAADTNADTGLLIVSGGNELRIGAHRGMAELAGRLAATGHPVFRYDRRGIGDSSGANRGFRSGCRDMAAAAATFAAEVPGLRRIFGFGICDGATALALFHSGANLDGLVLANPWLAGTAGDLPPAAIRARYSERLRDPNQWLRLATGGVNIPKLFKGIGRLCAPSVESNALAQEVAAALEALGVPLTLLLANRDNSAITFAEAWRGEAFASLRKRARVAQCDTASHSFAHQTDRHWLFTQVRAALGS